MGGPVWPNWLPETVAGRQVTPRGVHLLPAGYHDAWLPRADYWLGLMESMNLAWVVALSDGDAVTRPQDLIGGRSVVQLFLAQGIIPIVRIQCKLPRPYTHIAHVEELVRQYEPYGLRPIVQLANEPGDPREWVNGQVPDDWFSFYCNEWFPSAAGSVVAAGGVAGFADGPCYPGDPFLLMQGTWPMWMAHDIVYLGHHYGLNRPPAYPYDSVAQYGTPAISDEDLRAHFGPHYDDPGLNDVPAALMTEARVNWPPQPGLTAIEDDTCWRGWERVQYWMQEHFGQTLLMAMTEGGWTPGARAGSGPDADIRYPKPTPQTVAAYTLDAFNAETPMFAQCPWLLADQEMGGGGWPYDSWVGWAYADIYGREKPVVDWLQENGDVDIPMAVARLCDGQAHVGELLSILQEGP